MPEIVDLQHIALAAAIGFMIGFEREWRGAEENKSRTFAGARTFALVGFVGALSSFLGTTLAAVAFAAVAALSITAHWAAARKEPGTGGTTEVALIATFLLGVTAARGEILLAAVGGVAAAIILAMKPRIEQWAASMNRREVAAALRFLVISVIVLPLLPDQGYGPYDALNPRQIWWMVVLISGLSFLGYWLAKLYGRQGILLTGVVGGLASSTATTLSLSRLIANGASTVRAGAAGVIAANVVMLARVAVLLFVVSTDVLRAVWPALLAGGAAGALAALALWRGRGGEAQEMDLGNPLELTPALFFAALLAIIAVASRFATAQFGDSGLYILAFVSGLADVNAITLTAGDQAGSGGVAALAAGVAVMIAVIANIFVKIVMTFAVAGMKAGVRVAGGMAAAVAAGAAAFIAAAIF